MSPSFFCSLPSSKTASCDLGGTQAIKSQHNGKSGFMITFIDKPETGVHGWPVNLMAKTHSHKRHHHSTCVLFNILCTKVTKKYNPCQISEHMWESCIYASNTRMYIYIYIYINIYTYKFHTMVIFVTAAAVRSDLTTLDVAPWGTNKADRASCRIGSHSDDTG